MFLSKNLLLDIADAKVIKEGEKITLMNYGNVIVKTIEKNGEALTLTGEF